MKVSTYKAILDRLNDAEILLKGVVYAIDKKETSDEVLLAEGMRVGGLVQRVHRARMELVYWFDPSNEDQEDLPF